MEEWYGSLLDFDNCLGIDTRIAEILWSRFRPSAKLIGNCEEIRYRWVLVLGRGSHIRVERAQTMFSEDLLRLFAEKELDKCFGSFTRLMLIYIAIYHGNRILDQDCRGGDYQLIILPGLFSNQDFVLVRNCHIAGPCFKVGDALACALIECSDILEDRL